MAKRKHTADEIINKFREAEAVISAGNTVAEAVRRIGVSEQTFYRWRAEYGGLRVELGSATEAAGSGERQAETGSGRTDPGQPDTQGGN